MMSSVVEALGAAFELIKANVDINVASFQLAILLVFASPTWWNLAGRLEHNTRIFRKIFFGNKQFACYVFAVTVFSLSAYRNYAYKIAIDEQPVVDFGINPLIIHAISYALYAVGLTLVVSSSIRLGITGTYCGDYFGILMKERVTGFPFNYIEDPMYLGSTLNFLAAAVAKQSIAGLVLTAIVYTVYIVYSVWLENPYTSWIYSEAAKGHWANEKKIDSSKKAPKTNVIKKTQ